MNKMQYDNTRKLTETGDTLWAYGSCWKCNRQWYSNKLRDTHSVSLAQYYTCPQCTSFETDEQWLYKDECEAAMPTVVDLGDRVGQQRLPDGYW